MISILDIYIIKWTDENGTSHEERFPSDTKMFKRSQELHEAGVKYERYRVTTVKSEEVSVVERPY